MLKEITKFCLSVLMFNWQPQILIAVQKLLLAIASTISEFSYKPEPDHTFDAWYQC